MTERNYFTSENYIKLSQFFLRFSPLPTVFIQRLSSSLLLLWDNWREKLQLPTNQEKFMFVYRIILWNGVLFIWKELLVNSKARIDSSSADVITIERWENGLAIMSRRYRISLPGNDTIIEFPQYSIFHDWSLKSGALTLGKLVPKSRYGAFILIARGMSSFCDSVCKKS